MSDEHAALRAHALPSGTRICVLASGKAGHEANCFGVAAALGGEPQVRLVRPRAPFVWLSPWGPVDPRDMLPAPYPDIVIASGRITVPYLRAVKSASRGKTFVIYLQDPRGWRGRMDMICAPAHDEVSGPNVLKTLTSPHPITPQVIADARANPDPRIAALASPRTAIILGGPSGAHKFEPADVDALAKIAQEIVRAGGAVMVTPSRRTPPDLVDAIRAALADAPKDRAFVWDGTGANPYGQMLANADAILVTGDSVNMVSEAAASGAPVHVYEPSGGSAKVTRFVDGVIARGAARRWSGAFERWSYTPIDATAEIAAEIARRYALHRKSHAS